MFDLEINPTDLENDVNNKLLCTFIESTIENTVDIILDSYDILYGKIFILDCNEGQEYICTYNVDTFNISTLLPNTVSIHRKKHSNTLYTINGLNKLILKLNNNIFNPKFNIPWSNYRNTLISTKDGELQVTPTEIYRIIYTD